MKVFYLKSMFAAALAVTLSSCEKKAENFETLSETKTASISKVVYPLDGNEMSTRILPKGNLPDAFLTKGEFYENAKVKVIDLVCEDYLKGTTKLDLSKLKEGAFGNKIKNNEFIVNFRTYGDLLGDGFKKLNNGPNGWWTHWNYSPYTESEYPSVLFAADRNGHVLNEFSLIFDKKVTTFGFEVAPNAIGENFEVSVKYQEEDYYRQMDLFYVKQTVSSPSGARLIAVKSEIPFQRVTIQLRNKLNLNGVAITNIRYALVK